jgi:RimJ/RimL family protein N-acetyltransferase
MGIEAVRTARMTGTRPAFRDADDLHPVLADERVAGWLSPGQGGWTLSQVRALLVKDVDHWKRRALGRVGLARAVVDGAEEVEVAWFIAADRWGEGLATEMAAEAVRAAFEDVGLPDLVAFTLHDNVASRRVMERLGFAYERDVEHAGLPHVLYRLSSRP